MDSAQIVAWFKQQVLANEIAVGGATIVVLSSLAYVARSLPLKVWELFIRRVTLEVEIRQPDPLYEWISQWLSTTDYVKRARRLGAITNANQQVYFTEEEKTKLQVKFIPGIGRHFFRYQGHWLVVSRNRDDESKTSGSGGGLESLMQRESYIIRAPFWSRGSIQNFLNETREATLKNEGDGPDVYLAQGWGGWERMHRAQRRSFESVIMPDMLGTKLLEQCQRFLESQNDYNVKGIPWRLGVLLHGTPGNGKTSLIMAIASELNLDLGFINLSDDRIGDNDLFELFSNANSKAIVLEDIDAIYEGRTKREGSKDISFSGLLNALDGVVSRDGRIVIMTTNHPEKLDAALIRPGRADLVVEIPPPNERQLSELWSRFHDNGQPGCNQFVERHVGKSMAAAQGELIDKERLNVLNIV